MLRQWYSRFRSPLPLRSYLVALFLLAMTPLLAFAVYMIYRSAQEERATFRRGAVERARAITTAVDSELKSSITTLEALATSETLDRNDLAGFYDVAMRVFISQHDWTTINLADQYGKQLMNLLRPLGTELPPVAEPELVKEIVNSQKTVIGNLVLGTTTGQIDFAIRVPVVRNGRTKYVVSGVVKPAVIGAVLAKQQIPSGSMLAVIDANGRIVARTREPGRSLGQQAARELRETRMVTSEGWVRGRSLEGADVYRAYTRSPFSGWTVALNVPAAVVDAPLHGTPLIVGLFGLGVMLLGVALALVFSRRTAASIESLTGMAETLALSEHPKAETGASGIAEVEQLRQALATAGRLIDERVQERDAFERELWRQASLLELKIKEISINK
jgi:hypothetical protein